MVDVVGYLSDGSVPVKFDTDVNAPALAEHLVSGKSHGTRRFLLVLSLEAVHDPKIEELTEEGERWFVRRVQCTKFLLGSDCVRVSRG